MHILPVILLLLSLAGCCDLDLDCDQGFVKYNAKDDSYTSYLPKNEVNECGAIEVEYLPAGNEGFVQYSVKEDSYTSFHPTLAFGDCPPPYICEEEDQYHEYEDAICLMINDPSPEFTLAVLTFTSQFVKKYDVKLENSIMCHDKKFITSFRLEYSTQILWRCSS